MEGRRLRIGQAAFVSNLGGSATPAMPGDSGQWLLLGDEQGPLAWFGLDDRLRSDAPALLAACKARGWRTSCYPVTPRRWSPASLPNWASTKPAAA